MKKQTYMIAGLAVAGMILGGCRVEAEKETIPEAEGTGKSALNIRVETMSKEEIKNAANKAIDKTAAMATHVKDAASTAVHNAEVLGQAVTTIGKTMSQLRGSDATTTPAEAPAQE